MFSMLLLLFMASLLLSTLSTATYAMNDQMICYPVFFWSISLIILIHMVVALTRGFYIEHTIKNQTNKYTKEEFLEFIEKQKDVPDLNTDNIWRLFGYAIKEYIYKGKANRKYISKNIFLDRFPEEAINKDKQIKRT